MSAKLRAVTAPQTYHVSFFKNQNDIDPEPETLSLEQFFEQLKTPEVRLEKDGALFSPSRFKIGGKRKRADVESICMLVLDYDHEAIFKRELKVWQKIGCRAFAHTSHSHMREKPVEKTIEGKKATIIEPAEPRFRIVIPLAVPIPADQFLSLWLWAEAKSGRKIDAVPKSTAQMFYLPAIATKESPFMFEEVEGSLLDWRTLELPEVAEAKPKTRTTASVAASNGTLSSALLPQTKFCALCEAVPEFRQKFEHQVKLPKDNSDSAYDLALLNIAVEAGWNDEELAGLILAHRTKWYSKPKGNLENYLARTIEKARTKIKAVEADTLAPVVDVEKRIKEVGIAKFLSDTIKICEDQHFAVDGGGALYIFANGVYVPRGERFITRRVKQLTEELGYTKKWSTHVTNEVVNFIAADAPELLEEPPLDFVNLQNGLLDIRTRKLSPHSPDYLSPIQLPLTYTQAATCSAIDEFLDQVLPPDALPLALEIAGWLLTPDTSKQKAILALGDGGNGKSVFLNLLTNFIGRKNCWSESLHRLETNQFAGASLVGKLANICGDLPSGHLRETSFFKSVVGGDPVTVERKNSHSFQTKLYSRFIFSANHAPRSNDSSGGFFDRWLVVPFDQKFRGAKREISRDILDARLTAPQELSGLLNHALDALKSFQKTNRFTVPQSVRDAGQEFRAATDPFSVWLSKNVIEAPDAFVVKRQLRDAYADDCRRAGRPVMTEKTFSISMNQAYEGLRETQKTVAAKMERVWLGIGLKSSHNKS
jgi:putative DNA primase/helicase